MRVVTNEKMELDTLTSPRIWLLIVGFGLMLCYSGTYSLTALRMPRIEVPGVMPRSFTIAGLLIEAAAFIAIAVLSWRNPIGIKKKHPLFATAVVGCCALSALQCAVLANGSWPTPLAMGAVVCLIRSVCPALLWIAWFETLARFDARHVLVGYIAASIFSAGMTLFASQLPSMALALICGTSVLVSSVMLWVLHRSLDVQAQPHDAVEEQRGSWVFPATPVLLMAVFMFANVFARNVLQLENRGVADVGVLVVMSILLAALVFRKSRFKVWNLYALAFPLTLFGLFSLGDPQGSLGQLAIICIHAGDSLFAVFIGVVLCNASYRWGVPAALLFGCAKAAGALASLCGGFAASYALGLDEGGSTLLLALVGTGLAVCYVFFSNAVASEQAWGIPAEQSALLPNADKKKDELRAACSALAYRYGLTRREEQVLYLVAQGLTAAQIEEELAITNSTVKTHTNAVFRKMGVHSRKEITDIVGQTI